MRIQWQRSKRVERPLDVREAGIKEDWLRVIDAYRVQFLVLNRQSEGDVVKLFRSQPGWSVDFEDGESIIFARTDADQALNSRPRMLEGAP
jgi:hypothetical protein